MTEPVRWPLLGLLVLIVLAAWPPRAPLAQMREDTVVFALSGDIDTYDIHDHALRQGILVGYHLFDTLVGRDLKTLRIIPHLATSWRTLDDLTWELKLRPDVRFHNGDRFTAHTVKFNFDRVLDPEAKLAQRGSHAQVSRVEVVDDYTVRLRTARPHPLLLERLTQLQMLSEKVVREKGKEWIAEHPVGTGPYKLVSWKRKQEHLWVRNDDYWGPKPAFKYVRVRIIPEQATQIAELLAGTVDLVRTVPLDQKEVIDRAGQARSVSFAVLVTGFFALDSAGRSGPGPFQDRRVRQAMNHGVDVDGIVGHLLKGLVDRTATAVSPLAFGYDASIKPSPYDPDRARALLAEAGYPGGFDVRMRGFRGDLAPTNDAVAADLAKIGVRMQQALSGELSPYITQVRQGKAGPMFDWAWGYYSIFDADAILHDNFRCGEPVSYYCNKQLDELIDAARSTLDPRKRQELYSKAQRLLADDAAALFKWNYRRVWGISSRIEYSPPPDEIDRLFLAVPRHR